MIKYRKLKNLLIWKCKQKKVGSQLPAATRMAELEEVEPPVPQVLLPCTSCNRTFRPEALAKHSKVCEKSLMKKRKKFDSAKQRLQGTDVPVFPPPPKSKESPLKPLQQSKWREKQAEIARSLNSGRKKSEQTSTTLVKPSDHEQCVYCERYFGPKAYDRHTEWCKEQHIKLKNNNNINNEARERLQVRTKYRAPLSNRVLTRDKYLPRSRDPSPMSLSRIENEDLTKQKLPSPLNRTSSLRLSSRSKSMVAKSVPPLELKEGIVRKNQSSTSVRPNEAPMKGISNITMPLDKGVTQPKILSGHQSQKKGTESVSPTNCSRKQRSQTPVKLKSCCLHQVEELQVYTCLLQSSKYVNDCNHSDTDGKKRSASVSKSLDVLPCTYIIDRRRERQGTSPDNVQIVDGLEDLTYEIDGDETSEMISDEILRRSDSWKLLPVVLLNSQPNKTLLENKPNFLALEFNVSNTARDDEDAKESNSSEASNTDSDLLLPCENHFMAWLESPRFNPAAELTETNSCSDANLNSVESLFADFQNVSEPDSVFSQEGQYFNWELPVNFVKINEIIEVTDVGTTVDGLEKYVENMSPEMAKYEIQHKLDSSNENQLLKEELNNNHEKCSNDEKSTLRPDSVYVVSSTGSLKTYNEAQVNLLESDNESLASYPFPFLDILFNINEKCDTEKELMKSHKKVSKVKLESQEKVTFMDKAVDCDLVSKSSGVSKKPDRSSLLRFRELSLRSQSIQVNLPCSDCTVTAERLNGVKPSQEKCYRSTQTTKCSHKTDDSSWDFSTSSLPSWSSSERAKRYVKKKTVKYYKTIEYKLRKNEATTVKTTVQELESSKNPQKLVVVKTVKKEVEPQLQTEEMNDVLEEGKPRFGGSCKYLKLPPIQQRFERRDVVKYDPFASAEQQMLELFGGGSQKPPEKPSPETPNESPTNPDPNPSSPPVSSPTSAFAVFTPKSNRSSSRESLKLDNKENNNIEPDGTPSPPPNEQMNNNHKNFSLSNLSLCSIISIDSVDCNRNPVSGKSFRPHVEPLQRSLSASEGKSSRNRVKVNMQQMLYGFDSPEIPVSPTRSSDVRNLEACEAELIVSMMEFEKMLNSSPLPNVVSSSSPESPSFKPQDGSSKRDDELHLDSKAVVPLSIDSAYGSLTRASGDGDVVKVEASKFCHECGAKYPVAMAKFCCNCGIRRLAM